MPRKIGRPPTRPAVTTKEPGTKQAATPSSKAKGKPTGQLKPAGKPGVRAPVKKQGPPRPAPPSRDTFASKTSRPPAKKQVASAKPDLPASPRRRKPGPGPAPKVAVTASEAGALTQAAARDSLSASVVKSALNLKGKLHWSLPAFNAEAKSNDFQEFLWKGKAMDSDSRINCWEAVIFAAMEAGVLSGDSVLESFKPNRECAAEYNLQIKDWMLGDNPRSYNSPKDAKPGDIILFYGTAHVAVSLGGDRVMSLWSGPNGDWSFQETTISALDAKVKSNEALLVDALQACIYSGSYNGSVDPNVVLDLVHDYDDLLQSKNDPDLPEERKPSAKDLAEARAELMEAVRDFSGVQVARAPWKRMQKLAKEAKEY